jgi:ribosomal protein S18 acetylase RimI-like enzyme
VRTRSCADPIGSDRRLARDQGNLFAVLDIRPLASSEVEAVTSVLGLARLYQGDGVYFVAWEGSEPLGHLHLALTEPPELQDVEVRPDRRRRGVASSLLDYAEDEARRRGCDRLRLGVSVDNAPAQTLYLRHGYVDAGIAPKRIQEIVQLRTGSFAVDDTWFIWEKRLDHLTP